MRPWSPESRTSGMADPPTRADGCSADIPAGRPRNSPRSRRRPCPSRRAAGGRRRPSAPARRARRPTGRSRRSRPPRAPRPAMTRSSTPSKRPQTMTAPGPARELAHPGLRQRTAARAHQQARPRIIGGGDLVDGGRQDVGARSPSRPRRRPACRRRRGGGLDRGCGCRRLERPEAPPSASPASDWPSGPGNMSGNSVRTLAVHMDQSAARLAGSTLPPHSSTPTRSPGRGA